MKRVAGLVAVVALVTCPSWAWSQAIPPSASPGALLQYEQNALFYRTRFPYMFVPITRNDILPPAPRDVITIEEGVLLNDAPQTGIQGVLITPDGKATISPRE